MTALQVRPDPTTEAWVRCPDCATLHYSKRWRRNASVCPQCDHHNRLSSTERIELLVDAGSFSPLADHVHSTDVLDFTDSKPYSSRLTEARRTTGLDDAVVVGRAEIGGVSVCVAVMEFGFMGGSLGAAVGESITRAAELCLDEHRRFVIVTSSGGARMQEGAIALLQMAKVSQALVALREAGLLSISVVADPTYGGVAASFATSCDILVAEKNARLGFAGPRVIAQTIREELPGDFQTAGFLLEHGHIDEVLHRHELRSWLQRLLQTVSSRPKQPKVDHIDPFVFVDHEQVTVVDPWATVAQARDVARPTTLDYLARAFQGFVELHGDRSNSDCAAIVAGVARLDGRAVMVIGHQKGHTTRELVARQFGMADADGYRKALRLMRLADQLGLPIVSLVDTPGAYPGRVAEERGQSFAIADSIAAMFELRVPVVTVVTGEGGSGGALALAVADRVLMFERSIYSVISPEGCSSILWSDASMAPAAAKALHITARDLLELGVVDGVLREPGRDDASATVNPATMAATLHDALVRALETLCGQDCDTLVSSRRARFRRTGDSAFAVLTDRPPTRESTDRAVA